MLWHGYPSPCPSNDLLFPLSPNHYDNFTCTYPRAILVVAFGDLARNEFCAMRCSYPWADWRDWCGGMDIFPDTAFEMRKAQKDQS